MTIKSPRQCSESRSSISATKVNHVAKIDKNVKKDYFEPDDRYSEPCPGYVCVRLGRFTQKTFLNYPSLGFSTENFRLLLITMFALSLARTWPLKLGMSLVEVQESRCQDEKDGLLLNESIPQTEICLFLPFDVLGAFALTSSNSS